MFRTPETMKVWLEKRLEPVLGAFVGMPADTEVLQAIRREVGALIYQMHYARMLNSPDSFIEPAEAIQLVRIEPNTYDRSVGIDFSMLLMKLFPRYQPYVEPPSKGPVTETPTEYGRRLDLEG